MRALRIRSLLPALLLGLACQGQNAPDAAVCQDAIARLCAPPPCGALNVSSASECKGQLLAQTGCEAEDFTFTSPDRERFLRCRLPLLRAGPSPEDHPACDDVSETFERCPDFKAFFLGVSP